jgi:hypothetical protein
MVEETARLLRMDDVSLLPPSASQRPMARAITTTMDSGPHLRLVQATARPTVSVILVAPSWRVEFEVAVRAVLATCIQIGAELIVVAPGAPRTEALPSSAVQIRIVPAPHDADGATLRQLAVRAATGDIILVGDESCASTSAWRQRAVLARSCPTQVRAADARTPDWRAILAMRGLMVAPAATRLAPPSSSERHPRNGAVSASFGGAGRPLHHEGN